MTRRRRPSPLPATAPRGATWIDSWKIFAACVTLATLFVVCDTSNRLAVLSAATAVRTSEIEPGAAVIAAGTRERWAVLPAASVDTRWWVMHAEESLRTGAWRIRETKLDNAPAGREVHWSSSLVWGLRGIAGVRSVFTGRAASDEVQGAALWAGPLSLALCAAMLAGLVGRKFGWGVAGMMVLLLTTSLPIFEGFRAGEADHHGLIVMCSVGMVVCLATGGARGKIAAGGLAAAGMWLSAASTIPVVAACALGAMSATLARSRNESPGDLSAEGWRIFGLSGGVGSFLFYLLEYFPSHLGWRLEVNHPLYALAFLGGGELLHRSCRKMSGGRFLVAKPKDLVLLGASLIALLAPLIAILLWSESMFWVRDPFLLAVLTKTVNELRPLPAVLHGPAYLVLGFLLWPLLAIVSTLWTLLQCRVAGEWRSALVLVFVAASAIQIEALVQVRWTSLAIGLWSICLLLVVVVHAQRAVRFPAAPLARFAFRAVAAWAFVLLPQHSLRTWLARDAAAPQIPTNLAPALLLRDIAHRIIQANPSRVPVVLSDPTSSTDLSYFGGLKTVGTLYWENRCGLRRAAEIFAQPEEEVTRQMMISTGVTHVVIPSWDAFGDIGLYRSLLSESGADATYQRASYLHRVAAGRELPAWLRPVPYPIPEAFGIPDQSVLIWEVATDR